MKKYIKPVIEIEEYGIAMEILAGTTPQPGGNDQADGEAANRGHMGDSDIDFLNTSNNLWDED